MKPTRVVDYLRRVVEPVECPVCRGPARFVERVNHRDIFECNDHRCLMSLSFEILKDAMSAQGDLYA
jgi:hypothetical protein